MLVETSRTLKDPSGKTLYEAWRESSKRERGEAKQPEEVTDSNLADTRIGSGSDHTVFLNFVGMPVLGLQFDGPYGVYHSAYDDFFWMNHFGDPGYRYHTLMSQLWGVLALRLANADLLPFDFASYASNIRQFVNELAKNNPVILSEVAGPRSGAAAQSKACPELAEGDPSSLCATCGPSGSSTNELKLAAYRENAANTPLDLKPVLEAIDDFEAAGKHLDDSITRALVSGAIDSKLAAIINHGTMQVERNWLNPDGIPGRPWFKHILYGARFTYAHLELPGLTEAVEKQDWPTAKQQAEILHQALVNNTKLVSQLDAALNGETKE
jgi:N-acetylated-alpha-linked acidic dipeptidase